MYIFNKIYACFKFPWHPHVWFNQNKHHELVGHPPTTSRTSETLRLVRASRCAMRLSLFTAKRSIQTPGESMQHWV